MLKRVLDHINAHNYEDQGDFIIFGGSLGEISDKLTALPQEGGDSPLVDAVRNLRRDAKVHSGRSEAARRTSLDEPPNFQTNALDNLSPQERSKLRDLCERALQKKRDSAAEPDRPSESQVADDLDAALAEKVLGKLAKIVDRASRLDPLELNSRAIGSVVRNYFEEAHRCYLYGFHIACAVLCRAILESALIQKADPKRQIENELRKGRSYFKALVDEATKRKLLTDGTPEWAEHVKRAGDEAVHNFKKFNRDYTADKLEEVLLKSRKVLEELYRVPG